MIYQNGKYKRRRMTTNLDYPKLQHGEETTLTLCISPTEEPQGVCIGTRGKGARGTTPGPKHWRGRARTATVTRPRPHFRGSSRAARTAPAAARCRVCPLLVTGSDFWFWAPGFDESALQSQ